VEPCAERPDADRGVHLLAVDDDDLVRSVLVRQLHHLGYHTTAVADTAEALAALDADDAISVLLTDRRLGGGEDGCALAQESRARRPDLRVVFMTGAADACCPDAFPGAPVLSKPFRQADLAAALDAALA
jgi:CheY-like chemotaxis protein